jgi:hypothetical protein
MTLGVHDLGVPVGILQHGNKPAPGKIFCCKVLPMLTELQLSPPAYAADLHLTLTQLIGTSLMEVCCDQKRVRQFCNLSLHSVYEVLLQLAHQPAAVLREPNSASAVSGLYRVVTRQSALAVRIQQSVLLDMDCQPSCLHNGNAYDEWSGTEDASSELAPFYDVANMRRVLVSLNIKSKFLHVLDAPRPTTDKRTTLNQCKRTGDMCVPFLSDEILEFSPTVLPPFSVYIRLHQPKFMLQLVNSLQRPIASFLLGFPVEYQPVLIRYLSLAMSLSTNYSFLQQHDSATISSWPDLINMPHIHKVFVIWFDKGTVDRIAEGLYLRDLHFGDFDQVYFMFDWCHLPIVGSSYRDIINKFCIPPHITPVFLLCPSQHTTMLNFDCETLLGLGGGGGGSGSGGSVPPTLDPLLSHIPYDDAPPDEAAEKLLKELQAWHSDMSGMVMPPLSWLHVMHGLLAELSSVDTICAAIANQWTANGKLRRVYVHKTMSGVGATVCAQQVAWRLRKMQYHVLWTLGSSSQHLPNNSMAKLAPADMELLRKLSSSRPECTTNHHHHHLFIFIFIIFNSHCQF